MSTEETVDRGATCILFLEGNWVLLPSSNKYYSLSHLSQFYLSVLEKQLEKYTDLYKLCQLQWKQEQYPTHIQLHICTVLFISSTLGVGAVIIFILLNRKIDAMRRQVCCKVILLEIQSPQEKFSTTSKILILETQAIRSKCKAGLSLNHFTIRNSNMACGQK